MKYLWECLKRLYKDNRSFIGSMDYKQNNT